ncbi:hypothetical protein IEN91_04475 [Bacillus velezensis]|uniref:hypothetical protein n=1 Tax=Bacillus velezensis TaxID=492670 RepID=UPI0018C663BA|nr:hypothetical protein [Bacillus velezensis]QPK89710.1 hypothetical protein IEN91_04475 [Bacillus velezensis]
MSFYEKFLSYKLKKKKKEENLKYTYDENVESEKIDDGERNSGERIDIVAEGILNFEVAERETYNSNIATIINYDLNVKVLNKDKELFKDNLKGEKSYRYSFYANANSPYDDIIMFAITKEGGIMKFIKEVIVNDIQKKIDNKRIEVAKSIIDKDFKVEIKFDVEKNQLKHLD